MPIARGMAGGQGGSSLASTGYFLDGGTVAEGEVHGVDGGGVRRNYLLTACRHFE